MTMETLMIASPEMAVIRRLLSGRRPWPIENPRLWKRNAGDVGVPMSEAEMEVVRTAQNGSERAAMLADIDAADEDD